MNRNRILIVVGIIAVIVASFFVYDQVMYVKTDNAQVDAHAVLLAPKVNGYIIKVNVVEGQKVKAGEVMVEIDSRDFENSLRQISGELASLEARRHDAERTYRRLQDLFSKDAVSQSQYDQASAAYNDVRARYEGAAAQVAQAQLNIENTKIKAPSDGFIAKKSAEIGQLAAPGIPVVGFVDANARWITANFKETEVSAVKVGADVEIEVDAVDGKGFKGKVESISSATGATFTLLPPDNASGNFTKVVQRVPVKINFENISADDIEHLRAGLSAVVKVHKH